MYRDRHCCFSIVVVRVVVHKENDRVGILVSAWSTWPNTTNKTHVDMEWLWGAIPYPDKGCTFLPRRVEHHDAYDHPCDSKKKVWGEVELETTGKADGLLRERADARQEERPPASP
jgi:hypothetical protein